MEKQKEKKINNKKKEPFGGVCLSIDGFTITCDKYTYIVRRPGWEPTYHPTIGYCFDELFEYECKKNLLNNKNKGDILAIREEIEAAYDFINDIVEPLLNTTAYKHLLKKWQAETEVDLIGRFESK